MCDFSPIQQIHQYQICRLEFHLLRCLASAFIHNEAIFNNSCTCNPWYNLFHLMRDHINKAYVLSCHILNSFLRIAHEQAKSSPEQGSSKMSKSGLAIIARLVKHGVVHQQIVYEIYGLQRD